MNRPQNHLSGNNFEQGCQKSRRKNESEVYDLSRKNNLNFWSPLLLHILHLQGFQGASRPFVPITSYNNDVSFDGSYSYGYTTGDGQQQQASGYLKNPGLKDLEAQSVQGSYSYTSPEGQLITITYIADENGL